MIRLVFTLRRKPGMSLADFQQYWRTLHGPLVAKHAATLDIQRYVQLHTLEDSVNDQLAGARGKMEPAYDGVAELWWNNREALAASFVSAAGQAAGRELLEDEARFIDLPNSPLWFAYEYPQVNPTPEEMVAREHSSLVKLFFCLRHSAAQSMEEVQLYWRTNHGPTIRGVAQGMRLKRYLQVHRCEEPLEQQLRASRKTKTAPYTGHAEAWFDRADLAIIGSTPEGRKAMEIAVEDERKFIDFANSAIFIGKERVMIDRR
ncbi:MAG TPA: EthD domain-containing protein [Candidatus Binataceae bacterium]|nr:EthD domain-containing protein [Candidatus Binataceae bacterium]